jgi:UrcA family protein
MIKTLAIATAALVASTAQAQSEQMLVSYHGLDLSTATGQAQFDRRIAAAASKICGANGVSPLDLSRYAAVQACMKDVIANTAPRREIAITNQRLHQQQANAGGQTVAVR